MSFCDFMANVTLCTAQKIKFSIKDFFSKYDQIRRKLKKSLMENFIFCAVVMNPYYHSNFEMGAVTFF